METVFYYERKVLNGGSIRVSGTGPEADFKAIEILSVAYSDLEIIYKESDTPDGTPFITVWEKRYE